MTPLPTGEAEAKVDALLADSSNEVLKVAAEADLAQATQTFTEYASILNTLSSQAGSLAWADAHAGA